MKLHILFLVTHSIAAMTIAVAFVGALQTGGALPIAGAAVVSLAILGASAWYAGNRIREGLAGLESVVADHEKSDLLHSGLDEFDITAERIAKSAARWDSVAANTREQSREISSMMSLLNRRDTGEPSSDQLRGVLTGLGNALYEHLSQIERGAAEIQQYSKSITEGAESQGNAVIKTTTYVEQLSATIDSVATSAASAKALMESTGSAATEALTLLRELTDGMNQVRNESQNSEKKLRGLCDPTRQISAFVGTISDIAARTDLLALNASIESIRAGEHGRGFAIVAEEVRQLAEQATDATREISNLLDSMQLVTQETIGGMVREREQVESEAKRAEKAKLTLESICDAGRNVQYLQQISDSSSQQLQLAQDVVLAVEQISTIAKDNRGGAESVGWTSKSLAKANPAFSGVIERLRNCGNPSDFDRASDQARAASPATAVTPGALPGVAMPTSDMTPVG